MNDIVERLRDEVSACGCLEYSEVPCDICTDNLEAADKITRLRAENERLRERVEELKEALLQAWIAGFTHAIDHDEPHPEAAARRYVSQLGSTS